VFRFGFPLGLYAYLMLPVLVVVFWFAHQRRRQAMARFGELALVRQLSRTVSHHGRNAKMLLLLGALAMLVTGLGRPQFGTRVETVRREGNDIIVAIDLSNSMLAEDLAPNRLERAKLAVARLIDRLRGDRVGLVAFAGGAFVQSPLTIDYAAARLFLNAMDPGIMPVQGTNLGAALSVSLDAFDEDVHQHRVLVVITDGEDHEGEIETAVERAAQQGVRILTVGIGSADGVPIPEYDPSGQRRGFKRDADGNVVTTRLDQETLLWVADATGGEYYHVTSRGTELNALADEIASMGGREIEAGQVTQFEEQYQIFLGLGLVLLLVESLVPERRNVAMEWKGRFQ
jgi:Ca-activated chloride channel family protein